MKEPDIIELEHIVGVAHAKLTELAASNDEGDEEYPSSWEWDALTKASIWLKDLKTLDAKERMNLAIETLQGEGVAVKSEVWHGAMEKMLTISTSHVTEETAMLLNDGQIKNLIIFDKGDVGWFIFIDDGLEPELKKDLPKDLLDCFECALMFGCDWLCLDRDADTVSALALYDW